jgi:hypothetical protein
MLNTGIKELDPGASSAGKRMSRTKAIEEIEHSDKGLHLGTEKADKSLIEKIR